MKYQENVMYQTTKKRSTDPDKAICWRSIIIKLLLYVSLKEQKIDNVYEREKLSTEILQSMKKWTLQGEKYKFSSNNSLVRLHDRCQATEDKNMNFTIDQQKINNRSKGGKR